MEKTINEIALLEGQRALDRLTQALADAQTVAGLRGELLADQDLEYRRLTRCLEIATELLGHISTAPDCAWDRMARQALAKIEELRRNA